jgi:hypothetical protein
LESISRRYTSPYRDVIRAKIVLMAAQGLQNKEIAARLDLPFQIVCKWRKRFFEERLAGLGERSRSGRRPVPPPPELVVAVKAIACELPARLGLPFSRLHVPAIQAEVVSRGLVASISGITIWRWLAEDAIKPWMHRSWIFPRDPNFELKAGRALDLYARRFDGKELTADDFVISADEKTSIQARLRCHPSVAANSRHPMLVEHEYDRAGALAYIAAWDVHRAKLFGRLEQTTGIVPFGRLVAQVMEREPYRSARRVFWVLDNGSSHRGDACVRRLQGAYPNLVVIHLPIHASWINQIEIYFSILQRKVLTPSDSTSLDDLGQRILAFQAGYEETARPFEWKFTRSDLVELLARLALKEEARLRPAA